MQSVNPSLAERRGFNQFILKNYNEIVIEFFFSKSGGSIIFLMLID